MKIVMFTNTYLPHIGGVARSVSTCEEQFRKLGHDVRIVAPQFAGAADSTDQVLRTPAVQNFNGSDFSVTVPTPGLVAEFLDQVQPEVLHSHHPFLLGDAALRAAWTRCLPLVFTHHTLYEQYTHYVPLDSEALQRAVIQMVTEYSNLCDHVIAPSQSIADLQVQRGVTKPITVIPTGIDLDLFGSGNGKAFRRRHGIDQDALVIGHVGRLAAEKNLDYLARAVALFVAERPEAVFLVVGSGDFAEPIRQAFSEIADHKKLLMPGSQSGQDLADAYAAMDLFAFSSQSETQGLVLAEAMAARTPVLALDGPGVRDVMNSRNGRMLPADSPPGDFAAELAKMTADRQALRRLGQSARRAIKTHGQRACAQRILSLYEQLVEHKSQAEPSDPGPWDRLLQRIKIEWNLLAEKTAALKAALVETAASSS